MNYIDKIMQKRGKEIRDSKKTITMKITFQFPKEITNLYISILSQGDDFYDDKVFVKNLLKLV